MDPFIFYNKVRPYFKGFTNLIFENVELNNCDSDQRYNNPCTSSGGNGGYDPSFQMFEYMLGITIK